MKSKKLKMIIKTTLIMLAISVSPLYGKVAFADNISNLEQQFLLVTDGYNSDEIVVENGISLKFGETLNLSKYKNAKMSNSNIISISETGIVTPKKEGTVYLSKKIGNKIHVMEIYVSSNNKSDYFTRSSKEVDRNYYKVFIDPGHGGHDDGASSFGLKEDELNLKIGLKIQKKLEAKGIEVKMSRTSDEYLSLDERAKMANEYGADIFVSNHINSFEKDSAYGIETYYHRDKSPHKPLSDNIQENAIKETGAFNRGVKNANFAVLRESEMTSSLFEAGFISNKVESDKLKDDKYQEKIANAIVDGIDKYLKDNIKLNGNTTKPDTKPEEKPNENPNDKPETTVKKGIVTASSLNVRSGASTSSSIKGSLKKGSGVEIVSTSKGWHKIKYKGSYGYVSADYVKINSSSSNNNSNNNSSTNNKPETTVKKGTVTASSLNVRSGASTSSSIKGSLKKGSGVEIVSTSKGWHKIKYKGSYGYVSADYVKINSSSSNNNSNNNSSTNNKPETTVKKGTVTASSLNVRSGASTSSSIKGSLKKGSGVEIVSTSKGWHKIKYKGSYGYVSEDYVKVNSSASNNNGSTNNKPETTAKKGTVTASSLNVRSGASTSSSIKGSLKKGSRVEIVSTSKGWHKIKYKGSYGYVSADYIRI